MYVTVPLGPGGGLRYIWGGKKSNEKWNSKGASERSLGRVHKHSLAGVFGYSSGCLVL